MNGSQSKQTKILITGSKGFLGQHVTREFLAEPTEILTPSRRELDLCNALDVKNFFRTHRPEVTIHLAAACGGIAANIEQPAAFLHQNTLMGLNLLEACRLYECQRFVLVSTTCAYPQDAPIPLHEDSLWNGLPAGATRAYGLAKRFLHEAVQQYTKQYGLDGRILIPANLYGPGDHYGARSHVVAALIERYVEAKRSKAPSVTNWGDGSATREFLFVSDAARAIKLASFATTFLGPMNLGTGIETSIMELANAVGSITQYVGETRWDTSKPTGQPRRSLNVERLQALGFAPKFDLRHGLTVTIDDFMRRIH